MQSLHEDSSFKKCHLKLPCVFRILSIGDIGMFDVIFDLHGISWKRPAFVGKEFEDLLGISGNKYSFLFSLVHFRNVGLPEKFLCRTTVQGRYLISDDNGYTCTPLTVDKWSRCCPKTRDRFSCQGCNLVSKCCNSYEYCVSCCLNPYRTHKDLVLKVKIAKPVTAGTYASVFDFCAGRCRHNSASVVHENAYASDFHHCFSLRSNSSGLTELNSEGRLSGIDVVIGRQGESCNSVCRLRGQSCVPNRLFVLNKCETLQRYMSCQGSCFASVGSDQPAEVLDDAPKHMNPGACLYTQDESMLSCDGSHQHTKRLCPCA